MSTISQKLNQVSLDKTAIRVAIENKKGSALAEPNNFGTYAPEIDDLVVGDYTAKPYLLANSSSATEESVLDITITNYDSSFSYNVFVSDGSVTRINGEISWIMPQVQSDKPIRIGVTAEDVGVKDISLVSIIEVTALDVVTYTTKSFQYNEVNMSDFDVLANVEIDANGALSFIDVDTTNIISAASADSFDTLTIVMNGDKINIDGTDLVVSGVTESGGTYTVPTTTVTNGGTPSSAYISYNRATMSTSITQTSGENDFNGIGTDAIELSCILSFENIAHNSQPDQARSLEVIENGDRLELSDGTFLSYIIANNVSVDVSGAEDVYIVDTTSVTGGKTPLYAYKSDYEILAKFGDGSEFQSLVESNSVAVSNILVKENFFNDNSEKLYMNFEGVVEDGDGNYSPAVNGVEQYSNDCVGSGQSFDLNGSTSIDLDSNQFALYAQKNISLWFNVVDKSVNNTLLNIQQDDAGWTNFSMSISGGNLVIGGRNGDHSSASYTNNLAIFAIDQGVWNHIVLTKHTPTEYRVYLNNSVAATFSFDFFEMADSFRQSFFVFKNHADDSDNRNYFVGKSDQIRVFDRSLSVSEVNDLYSTNVDANTVKKIKKTFNELTATQTSQNLNFLVKLKYPASKLIEFTGTIFKT